MPGLEKISVVFDVSHEVTIEIRPLPKYILRAIRYRRYSHLIHRPPAKSKPLTDMHASGKPAAVGWMRAFGKAKCD